MMLLLTVSLSAPVFAQDEGGGGVTTGTQSCRTDCTALKPVVAKLVIGLDTV